MKVRNFSAIVANIAMVAAKLSQATGSSSRMDGKQVVIMDSDDVLKIADEVKMYCNQLLSFIPDIDMEINDASHRDDE